MLSVYSLTAFLGAYILGSIPSAVWIGRSFYGIDVREYGSGNAGATNTFRVLGKKPGIIVLVLDICKGLCATKLAYFIGISVTGYYSSARFINYQLVLGVVAVVGHLFPIFAGFRGGKGVATLLGMVLGVHHQAALLCLLVFIVIFLISRYVSLSSITAGMMFPIFIIFIFGAPSKSLVLYGFSISALLLITHQKNIERLLRGTESRISFRKKKESIEEDSSDI